jgi:hypothetical protein
MAKQIRYLVLLACLFCVNSSCFLLTKTTKTEIAHEEGEEQEVKDIQNNETLSPEHKTDSTYVYKLDNKTYYQLKRSKEGKLSNQSILPQPRNNISKSFAKYAGYAAIIPMLIGASMTASNEGNTGPIVLGISTAAWLWSAIELWTMPDFLHSKFYKPLPLLKKPKRQEDERYLIVNDVSIGKHTTYTTYHYTNFRQYKKDESLTKVEEEGEATGFCPIGGREAGGNCHIRSRVP